MQVINIKTIEKAVYDLCFLANTRLNKGVYSKVLSAYLEEKDKELKNLFGSILLNAKIANDKKRPLCQDTGQVLVFVELGQNVKIADGDINEAINRAVEKCYVDNFFRKSVVKDALLDRTNTKTNTPAIVYFDIVEGNEVKISVLIKGAGSENKSKSSMLLPTSSKEEIKKYIADCVIASGLNSCPPLFIGVGIGGTSDKSSQLAKKALLNKETKSDEILAFEKEIIEYINDNAPYPFKHNYVLDLSILTYPTHIACLPVSVCINCHSSREYSCSILGDEVKIIDEEYDYIDINLQAEESVELNTDNVEGIKKLSAGEQVLLSGEIYVARDAAHVRLVDLINKNEPLPFDMKNKIILYAGPCPCSKGEIIGPIGPTTSSRMDKFTPVLHSNGLLATIGKGDRSEEVVRYIKENNVVYFTAIGGIASLLASRVKSAEIIAFDDLGAEALYKLEIDKLPLKVEIASK